MKRVVLMITVLAMIVGSAAYAAIPQKLSYQGVLTNAGGGVVPNGNYNLTLSLYDTLSGGTAVWTEAQLVNVTNGIFNVILGSVVPIHIAFDRPLYLGVAVAGNAELTPRTLLTASPYSLNAPVMVFVSSSATTDIPLGSWVNYAGDSVTLNCPAPGFVVCQSEVWIRVNHSAGEGVFFYVVHDTSATGAGPDFSMRTPFEFQPASPTVTIGAVSLPVQTIIAIPSAGPRTFYLNAMKSEGASVQEFYYASTVVTWYPATGPVPTMMSHSSANKAPNKPAK